jgi:hypothetical protein
MKVYEGVEVDIQAFLTCAVAGVGRPQHIRLLIAPKAEGLQGKYPVRAEYKASF